jgi:hypothetical protein
MHRRHRQLLVMSLHPNTTGSFSSRSGSIPSRSASSFETSAHEPPLATGIQQIYHILAGPHGSGQFDKAPPARDEPTKREHIARRHNSHTFRDYPRSFRTSQAVRTLLE